MAIERLKPESSVARFGISGERTLVEEGHFAYEMPVRAKLQAIKRLEIRRVKQEAAALTAAADPAKLPS